MKTYYSDKKGRKFISLAGLVLTVAALVLLNILRLYIKDKFPKYLPDMTPVTSLPVRVIQTIMLITAVVYLVFIIVILPQWYQRFRYVLYDNRIVSYSGLFSRTYRIMRFDAVQHITYISMPFSKYTAFNVVTLNALGGNLLIMFLSDNDCREIIDKVEKCGIAVNRGKRRERPAVQPVRSEEAQENVSRRYSELSDGQLTLPELAETIENEMSQLAFFDVESEAPAPAAAPADPPDPKQTTLFPSAVSQLNFDEDFFMQDQ